VVFVTAYDQYAVKAFETHAVDYLLKPIDADRLKKCVARLESRAAQSTAVNERSVLIGLVSELTGRSPDSVSEAVVRGNLDTERRYVSRLAVKEPFA
jgi:two-component system LytT family response regulator